MLEEKKMTTEKAIDESITSAEVTFTANVWNRVLDSIVKTMEHRFTNNNMLLLKIIIVIKNYNSFINGSSKNAFTKLVVKVKSKWK